MPRWRPPHPPVELRPASSCLVGDRFSSWSLAHGVAVAAGVAGWGVCHAAGCGCGGFHVVAGPASAAGLVLPESSVTAQQPREGP